MNKLLKLAMVLLATGTLALAQTGGSTSGSGQNTNKETTSAASKKTAKTSKAHKSGKRAKRSADSTQKSAT
jgi:hypothetical protein